MSSRARITWRVEHPDADRHSRALIEARDPAAVPAPIIVGDAGDELPATIRGLRHAYVDPALVEDLSRALEQTPGVEEVERSPRWEQANARLAEAPTDALPELQSTNGRTPDLRGHQRYLLAAPRGVGVLASRATPGVRGQGVLVVDIEFGWRLDHEQLAGREVERLDEYGQLDDHGTAVLGILGASDNARGVVGIVPEARLAVAVGDPDGDGRWNPEAAIYQAMQRISEAEAGGVIVLEMQVPDVGNLPVEWLNATFHLVRLATSRGVHVVAAAGNGGRSLDGDDRFDRSVRDSGAIVVGGGASGRGPASAQTRLEFSNYGARVDVQGWGHHVATCGGPENGYDDLWPGPGRPRHAARCYTGRFDGTSAATPIVAGCVAAILGACAAAGRPAPTPTAMRALLRETGTPQPLDDRPRGRIGPLPNLRAALDELALP